MTLEDRPVSVLGGGIAGLAVALALARHGARVEVIEQAPRIAEVGAGLQISPNGAVVLQALGLGEALARAGLPLAAVVLRDGRSGATVTRLDTARARWRGGFHLLHRADLVELLEAGARAAGVEIVTGRRVEAVADGDDGVRLGFADGAERVVPLAVAADGLHSVARGVLDPGGAPFFTGQVAWRAVIAGRGSGGEPAEAQVFMGPGRHLVSYPLRGGALRNLVAVEERAGWAAEGWHHRDDPARMRAAFAGFGGPVPGWLAQVEEVHLWGLFRHPVAQRWHGRRLAILGDAAHPTLPFLAQGANMALEDAWVLAAALAAAPSPEAGLAAYQAARAARVRRIVEAANRNARAYHLSGPLRLAAHAALRLGGRIAPGAALARFAWVYGHDVTAKG